MSLSYPATLMWKIYILIEYYATWDWRVHNTWGNNVCLAESLWGTQNDGPGFSLMPTKWALLLFLCTSFDNLNNLVRRIGKAGSRGSYSIVVAHQQNWDLNSGLWMPDLDFTVLQPFTLHRYTGDLLHLLEWMRQQSDPDESSVISLL